MRLQVIGQTKHSMGARAPVWRKMGADNQQAIAVGRGIQFVGPGNGWPSGIVRVNRTPVSQAV